MSLFEARRAREILPGSSALLATALSGQYRSALELRFRDSFVNVRTGQFFIVFELLFGERPTAADIATGMDTRVYWRVTAEATPDNVFSIPADPWAWVDGSRRRDANRGGSPAPPLDEDLGEFWS